MPRYFFNLRSDAEHIHDDRGVVLDNLKAAHRHAVQLITEIRKLLVSEEHRTWRVEIENESRRLVLTALLHAPRPRSLDRTSDVRVAAGRSTKKIDSRTSQ
jgi:hypothetical protein